MKVLAIGRQADKVAEQFFQDAEIVQLDMKPHNWQMKGIYDAVLVYHVLPRLSHHDVGGAMRSWVECLKPGGEFHLYTPSAEWAARQILSADPSPATSFHLFGSQMSKDDFHLSAYTLHDLRELCDKLGISVQHARVGEYDIGEHTCEMHLVLGVKR